MGIRNKYIFILILLFSVLAEPVLSQTPYFIHHNVIKGRKGYRSQVIFQDHEGFIWIGTSEGLILNDGVDFINYTEANGLAGSNITAICEDSVGRMWIGHNNGRISTMYGGSFSAFMPEEGLGSIPITDLVFDEKGQLWFSTLGEGIYYYTGERLYNLDSEDGLADDYAYSIALRGEEVCIGTDYGISIYDTRDKSFSQISMKDGIPDNIIKKIEYDSQGNLWVGTDEAGIFSILIDSKELTELEGWKFGSINDFVLDDRDIWISTDRNGVVQLTRNEDGTSRYKLISSRHGLKSDQTHTVFLDREKNLWIGARDEVTQSVTSVFEFLDDRHGLPPQSMVYDFLIDENDFYWVCSNKGLYKLTESPEGGFSVEKIFRGRAAENYNFISLYLDEQSYIWAGTYDQGVLRIDPATLSYRLYTTKDGLCDNNVISITANDKWILFSTLGGGVSICNIQEESISFQNLNDKHPKLANYVYGTLIDSKDRIWLAQDADRLTYLENNQINSFGEEDSLNISTVYSLIQDHQDNIWFSTSGEGLYCYDGQEFINYNENTGLSSSDILSIENDGLGNLVIVTNEGIDLFDPESKYFRRFRENYGVSYREPQLNSIYAHGNGDVWIGTGNGLIKYKSSSLLKDTVQPLIFLMSTELLSQEIEMGKNRFSHKQNHFTFRYTGMWYQDPERLRYRSMLEGYDREWSSPSSSRDRTYSKLPPGDYTFRVETSSDYIVWIGSDRAVYSFTIRPPFWKTWWFILASIIAAFLIILSIFRYRLASLRRQKEELESEVAKATAEIRNQNEELESQNNEIQAQRDLVMDQRDQIIRQQEELQSSIRYAHSIQTAVRTPMNIIERLIPDCFILDMPRDIVSGDFYWVSEKEGHVFASVADCTGHGVPGAFMSMLGISGFNEILASSDCGQQSNGFLNLLRNHVKNALHHTGKDTDAMDGMDLALIILNKDLGTVSYSGANNPLFLIRNGELKEFKGDKMPIGWHSIDEKPFSEKLIDLKPGDCLYLFSDGYVDQFGGPRGKKFMHKRFKELLLEIHRKPMKEQQKILDKTIVDWMDVHDQIDDIMVMGIRI